MFENHKSFPTVIATLLILLVGPVAARAQVEQDRWEEDFKPDAVEGQRLLASKCGSCHGIDGRGTERAPNIADSAKLRNLSDIALSGIISNGIPGAGMPAFRSLGPSEVRAVVSYLRLLQGKSTARALPGDPLGGKTVFFGKGDCSSCHMVNGQGGFVGPDLSSYGATLSAKEILEAITKPRKDRTGSRAVEAVTQDGLRVLGSLRDEDNFSVQIQTADGAFHSFLRSELRSLKYEDRPIMPANYAERLTHDELGDLVSYLMSQGQTTKADPGSPAKDSKRQDNHE
jgi:cytochrome c oxidase cbb3-type subunit III